MNTPDVKPNRVLCAACREPLGLIMNPDSPGSHQSSRLTWPKKGALALIAGELVHVMGEKVHWEHHLFFLMAA